MNEFCVGFAVDGRGVELHQKDGPAFFIGGPAREFGVPCVRRYTDSKLWARSLDAAMIR